MRVLRRTTRVVLAGFVLCGVAMAAAPAANSQADIDPTIARTIELTNLERAKNGLAPLAHSTELSHAAQTYSAVLATSGCFAHACGPVPEMADRLSVAGYIGWTAIAENIAAGYPTPEAVVQGWMASPGHRANMLSPRFTEIGIGLAWQGGSRYGTFWTQNFGTRPSVPVAPAPESIPETGPELEPEPSAEEAMLEPAAEPAPEPEPESLLLGLGSF